ncbi:tetratricopeptide repeat protein [Polaribacter porphyrae]|uniref:Uncharacterized protein n=1 Tax=Polaribacter porphyrae TaxID=1137780 RepID=A0A2S7WSI4_9FLAO|nr:hypothetical protein [Polaribacter porphyrae]PQJ80426.1 hypothetical protein BTO18_15155 [Polaribacter porphyrae]
MFLIRVNKIELIEKRQFIIYRLALFSLFYILLSLKTFSQDSIPAKKDLTEEAELKFQQFFFKALSQKAIGNHQKAIENLENCNQILPNDASVFFEFSKNYLSLNNKLLAKEYIDRALKKDSNNIWMLKHLVKVYQKDNNLSNAIEIQQKIIAINPKERGFLVKLYLYNRDYEKAISLLNSLAKDGVLDANLKNIKRSLENRKVAKKSTKKIQNITDLIDDFEREKKYTTLEKILKISKENAVLLKYSEQGITLFPAQPFVYFVHGKTLNYQKNYKKALSILENGIDFVIEDKMEADFYKQMAKAHKGLGNSNEEKKYQLKAKKLKI